MDPTTTLNIALFHLSLATKHPNIRIDGEHPDAAASIVHLEHLVEWLKSGGFPPYVGRFDGSGCDFYVPPSTPEADPDA